MLLCERLSLYFLSLFITETLLQFKNELVGILMQAILDNFSQPSRKNRIIWETNVAGSYP